MNRRIYAFTKYTKLGASSRMRFYNYSSYLEARYEVVNYPLFDDMYIERLYSGRKKLFTHIFILYVKRLFCILRVLACTKNDIIWVEKELFPYIPFAIEKVFSLLGKNVIYDYDDAVFHNYDKHKFKRRFHQKFVTIANCNFTIFSGNEYISSYFYRLGASDVLHIPTVIDKKKYTSMEDSVNHENSIVWIGTPNTQKYLTIIDSTIKKLQSEFDFEFSLIGVNPQTLSVESSYSAKTWSEVDEVKLLSTGTIGVMPLPDNKFEKGKCGYKLIQYMALGIPVVASPVGVNNALVSPNCGYLASTELEWYTSLKRLLTDKGHSRELGSNGKKKVLSKYTYDIQSKIIMSKLELFFDDK